jgi:hypothetical protein
VVVRRGRGRPPHHCSDWRRVVFLAFFFGSDSVLFLFYFLLVRVLCCYVFWFLFMEIDGGGGSVSAQPEVVLVCFLVHTRFEIVLCFFFRLRVVSVVLFLVVTDM